MPGGCEVIVLDNYHYGDEDERYSLGIFPSVAAAVEACKKLVDEYLQSAHQPGMSSEALYVSYLSFGEDPMIISSDDEARAFSAWDYAKQRCAEICGKDSVKKDGGVQ